PWNLNELRRRINEEIHLIPSHFCKNAIFNFYTTLAYCQTVNGKQFEYLL
ncbi:hypothetical protein EAI_04671, partial [Harpegnathos saltator]